MKAFTEQVKTARARTGELGDDWPKAAKDLHRRSSRADR
jgi:multiple sugar transport system substrate-binding protein